MKSDSPIVEEVRKRRCELSEQFGNGSSPIVNTYVKFRININRVLSVKLPS